MHLLTARAGRERLFRRLQAVRLQAMRPPPVLSPGRISPLGPSSWPWLGGRAPATTPR